MRRSAFVVLMSMVLACHPSSENAPLAPGEQVSDMVADGTIRVDPAISDAERACDGQHDGASCARAAEYWQGRNGHAFLPQKSHHYAAAGCEAEHALSCALLGDQYANGSGVEWSPPRAVEAYQRACNAGAGLGCAGLAAMYERGHGVDPDRARAWKLRERARELWLAACQADQPRWCVDAARDLGDGEPATQLYERACRGGIAEGCIHILADDLERRAGSPDAAIAELDRLCSGGQAEACVELAAAVDTREAVHLPARAIALIQRACTLGEPSACVRLGMLHEADGGVPIDDPVARRYFRRACDRGSSRGCWHLVEDLLIARGDARDIITVATRGCELGSRDACGALSTAADRAAAARGATEACRMGSHVACTYFISRGLAPPNAIDTTLFAAYRAACLEKLASACTQLGQMLAAKAELLRAVFTSVTQQDAAAFSRLLAGDVVVHDLQFSDTICTEQFAGASALTAAQHPALLRCLARAGLRMEPALHRGEPPYLLYGNDQTQTLHLDVHDGHIRRIYTPSGLSPALARALTPSLDTARPERLEALRIAGDRRILPGDRTHSAIAAAGSPTMIGTFKLCISTRGTVTQVDRLRSTGSLAYDRKIEREIYRWKYSPFIANGQAWPICSTVTFLYSQR